MAESATCAFAQILQDKRYMRLLLLRTKVSLCNTRCCKQVSFTDLVTLKEKILIQRRDLD